MEFREPEIRLVSIRASFQAIKGDIPSALAKVGALAGGLEKQPLRGQVFLGGGFEAKLARFVIVLDEVFDDGAGLPQLDPSVWILNSRDTKERRADQQGGAELRGDFGLSVPAVRVDVSVWLGLDLRPHVQEFGLIGNAEFLQEYDDLPGVRARFVRPEGNWL